MSPGGPGPSLNHEGEESVLGTMDDPAASPTVDVRVPIGESDVRPWVEVAHSTRILQRIFARIGDPAAGSNFATVNAMYPQEKASDWCRSFLQAALEHLAMWADYVAPLKFHPEQVVVHSMRPAYTLSRAALESSAQAVWLLAGGSARECALRHARLIRWDYAEHRKSLVGDAKGQERVKARDRSLLQRFDGILSESDLHAPSLYTVIRGAAPIIDRDPDEIERLWRAASGAAHGKAWPALALQDVFPGEEYEPGHFRTVRVPNVDGMTAMLMTANEMTQYGVLRYADFSGADIAALLEEAKCWLAGVIPLRAGADPAVLGAFLSADDLPGRHPGVGP